MSKFHEIDGRRGYFLVVSEGGTESDCLTPQNADGEADHIQGNDKAIFWQYLDEQPSKEKDGRDWIRKPAVRHFVADVSFEPRRADMHYLVSWRDPATGVWQACEAFLIAAAARIPDAVLKARRGP